MKVAEINFLDIEENNEYIDILNKVLEKCFEEENLNSKNLYINIVLTNPQNIKEINKQYRNIDKETDVLSFPATNIVAGAKIDERYKEPFEDKIYLGDMAICLKVAAEQARNYNETLHDEICRLFVHSLFHLFGYDHIKDEDYNVMHSFEKEILKDKCID